MHQIKFACSYLVLGIVTLWFVIGKLIKQRQHRHWFIQISPFPFAASYVALPMHKIFKLNLCSFFVFMVRHGKVLVCDWLINQTEAPLVHSNFPLPLCNIQHGPANASNIQSKVHLFLFCYYGKAW